MATIIREEIDAAFAALVRAFGMSPPMTAPSPVAEPATPVNGELLHRTLEHLTANPAEHQQTVWARRTETGRIVGCLAYHATRLAGRVLDWNRGSYLQRDLRGDQCGHLIPDGRGGPVDIFEAARRELRLDNFQARRLFSPLRSLQEQWEMAEEFTGGAITPPWKKEQM